MRLIEMDEQRSLPRKRVGSSTRISSAGRTVTYALAVDLSESGLGVILPYPISSGEEYEFALEVFVGKERNPIHVFGTPVYFYPFGAAWVRAGIRLSEVHPGSLIAFIRFME